MKIPVVLSIVHVAIDADGMMAVDVDVDGVTRESEQRRTRGDLRAVIDEITSELGAPVRVEIREADGSTYSDIATPPESPAPAAAEPPPNPSTPALAGAGFQPGEEVALAYVVVRQNADAEGNASLNLPPALLAATRGGLVLLGMSSRTVTPFEAPA
ncbi:hypothetical protein GGQ22_19630 [Nocardioides sp. zg-579]|uniref:Uncharacterized protein n=1 Tax=Nocardioides marmotae TaxID=2663857 RepID=A0A6I3JGT1_9ACTN|nr:hypothetical protein [Nocardioides marmotae]MCR6033622.1 hypothetical protein [Gordonia jinghuaiqii]MTB97280.1 hypothetical protein [Nocardioides marmotae]QKE01818.1 hypothetical protein HPC71_12615 [Nocardioides marmotae]